MNHAKKLLTEKTKQLVSGRPVHVTEEEITKEALASLPDLNLVELAFPQALSITKAIVRKANNDSFSGQYKLWSEEDFDMPFKTVEGTIIRMGNTTYPDQMASLARKKKHLVDAAAAHDDHYRKVGPLLPGMKDGNLLEQEAIAKGLTTEEEEFA